MTAVPCPGVKLSIPQPDQGTAGLDTQALSPPPAPDPADLRAWAWSLLEAREQDRRRIARSLHDELGQLLSALKLELASLAKLSTAPEAGPRMASMKALIEDSVVAVRRISDDLRPLMLDDLGLNAAVESLGRTAAERMGIEVTVRHDEHDPPIPPSAATALYRMVQEALTNVARHARATDVSIDLRVQGEQVVLLVEDNGLGLPGDALQRAGSWGLRGLREQVALCGGHLELDNAPGSGARLKVRLPLDGARAEP